MWVTRDVQLHGSYCNRTMSLSRCWGPVTRWNWGRLVRGKWRRRWPEAPQYMHKPLLFGISQWLKSGLINFHGDWSICRSRGVWCNRWEWYLGMYKRGMSWKWTSPPSPKLFLAKFEKMIVTVDCLWDNEVGSGKFKRRFLTLLRRPRQKWSIKLWSFQLTSHASCQNSEA